MILVDTGNCSFHVMQRRDIRQALAHDEHFEQAGFEALLRRDPTDVRREEFFSAQESRRGGIFFFVN